jgi:hypothetical protein
MRISRILIKQVRNWYIAKERKVLTIFHTITKMLNNHVYKFVLLRQKKVRTNKRVLTSNVHFYDKTCHNVRYLSVSDIYWNWISVWKKKIYLLRHSLYRSPTHIRHSYNTCRLSVQKILLFSFTSTLLKHIYNN